MVNIDQLAEAALRRDSLLLRSLTQDLLREAPRWQEMPRPNVNDPRLLVIAAALVELFAERQQQPAPLWAEQIGAMAEPFFLVSAAERMTRLRHLCESNAPAPMKKRLLYAPPNFLEFV